MTTSNYNDDENFDSNDFSDFEVMEDDLSHTPNTPSDDVFGDDDLDNSYFAEDADTPPLPGAVEELPRQKKSGGSKKMLMLLAGVAVVAFGGLMMFGGDDTQPMPQQALQPVPSPAANEFAQPQDMAQNMVPDAMDSGAVDSGAVVPPAMMGADDGMQNPDMAQPYGDITAPSPADIGTPLTPMPTELSATPADPTTDPLAVPALAATTDVAPPMLPEAVTAPAVTPPPVETQIAQVPDEVPTPVATIASVPAELPADLTNTLEKLNSRLDSIEKKLQMQDKLQASVNKLSERVENMQSAPAPRATTNTVLEEHDSSTPAPAAKKAAPAPAKKAPVKKPAPVASEDRAYVPPPLNPMPTAPVAAPAPQATMSGSMTAPVPVNAARVGGSGPWTLRGAFEGNAFIARSGSADIVTVRVGDNVPDLGVVSAIRFADGKWQVVGSNGVVTE